MMASAEEVNGPLGLVAVQEPGETGAKEGFFKRILKLLPFLSFAGIILLYYSIPNYLNFTATHVYPSLIGIFLAIYLILLICSFWNAGLNRALQDKAPLLLAVSIAFFLWDWLTLKTATMPMPYFPWPDKILNALVKDWSVLGISLFHSIRLLGTGYLVGASVGLITGVLMGWNKKWSYWLMPAIKVIGPVPAVTWIPLVMILFPTSFMGSAFLISLAVWFPVTLMTSSGIANVKNAYFEVARTLGADEQFLIFQVAVPAALPNIFLGLFQGMGVSCATLIVAEMVGVKAGLGWYITWAIGWAEYDKVYASIVLLFLLFFGVITMLFKFRDRVLSWQKGVIKW
jgi:NitT/TauT family transport system permease protein